MLRSFLFGLLGALFACTGPSEPLPPAPVADDRPVVALRGLWASRGDESRLDYLLDGDTATRWVIQGGAGEDIRLSFPEAGHALRVVRYEDSRSDTLATAARLRVYADGRPAGMLRAGDSLSFSSPPGRITFVLDQVEGEEEVSRLVAEGMQLTIHRLPSGRHTTVGDLRFFDESGTEYRVLPPRRVEGRLLPSSNLMPLRRYHAGLLFDGRPDRAWVEGNEGSGIGEQFHLELADTVRISRLLLWNGNQESVEAYQAHPRLRSFSFGRLGDTQEAIYAVGDTMAMQGVTLPSGVAGTSFSFVLRDVFPGRVYSDLALGELCLLEGERALAIDHQWNDLVRAEVRAEVAETPLAEWLDRRILNTLASADGDFYRRQSLLFHGDGTFSGFTEDWSAVENRTFETRIQGAWQLLARGAASLTLRLQGEKTNFALLQDAPQEAVQPFSDVVTWENGQLRGERYLDIYYLY